MLTLNDIAQIYEDTKSLGRFQLPDHLWENGVFVYTQVIDQIRTNQECLSEAIIRVSRERLSLGAILRIAAKTSDENWPDNMPKKAKLEDLEAELSVLLENLKLLHGECNRARSDLKTKVQLMDMEAKMGASGLVGDQRTQEKQKTRTRTKTRIKEALSNKVETEIVDGTVISTGTVDWDTTTDTNDTNETKREDTK